MKFFHVLSMLFVVVFLSACVPSSSDDELISPSGEVSGEVMAEMDKISDPYFEKLTSYEKILFVERRIEEKEGLEVRADRRLNKRMNTLRASRYAVHDPNVEAVCAFSNGKMLTRMNSDCFHVSELDMSQLPSHVKVSSLVEKGSFRLDSDFITFGSVPRSSYLTEEEIARQDEQERVEFCSRMRGASVSSGYSYKPQMLSLEKFSPKAIEYLRDDKWRRSNSAVARSVSCADFE